MIYLLNTTKPKRKDNLPLVCQYISNLLPSIPSVLPCSSLHLEEGKMTMNERKNNVR